MYIAIEMGLTKTEINLRRLLKAMPEQTNQAKLAQYIATLKEQLAMLTGESGQGNLPCISAEKAKEYAEQIELAASRINADELPDMWERLKASKASLDTAVVSRAKEPDDGHISSVSSGLRKRPLLKSKADGDQGAVVRVDTSSHEIVDKHRTNSKAGSQGGPAVKVDSSTLELIEKHRHLQEDLTDELVELARQMKEAGVSMNRAVLESGKVVDSTEQAIEHSLASTNRANKRAQDINSQSFKTGCLTWLIIFVMCCMFLLMVFLIRVT